MVNVRWTKSTYKLHISSQVERKRTCKSIDEQEAGEQWRESARQLQVRRGKHTRQTFE